MFKKIIFLGSVSTLALLSQVGTIAGTGTGQAITGTFSIPLGPSAITTVCSPAVLQKASSVACTVTLDQAVPPGMTFTGTPTIAVPAGSNVTLSPQSFTIPAGSTTCGSATVPCFTVTRQ